MLALARYGTHDVARAKAFYDSIAEILGASRVVDRHGVVGYRGPDGGTFLIGKPREGEANVGNGTQIGLIAPTTEAVDRAHAKALELGGLCLGPPGPRGAAENGLYAAYFRDLDGNKVMVFNARLDPVRSEPDQG